MSNFIHDIEITNFKSIRHQKIEGCKRINVFIGYPNVGKSNILEAISLFGYSRRDTPEFSSLVRVLDMAELFFNNDISVYTQVVVNSNDKVGLSFLGDKEVGIRRDAQINTAGSWEKIADAIGRAEQVVTNAQNPSSGVSVEMVGNENYTRAVVKKYHYQHGVPLTQKGYRSLYFPRGENLFYTLETLPALRKEVAAMFLDYGLKLAFTKGEKYALKALKTLQDDSVSLIPYYQLADTLQRLIFYKAAIASNKDTVLLFEEPEAHMFPPYISKFTADVMFNENGNQFFINTHSPFVINDFMENLKSDELSIYVVGYKKSTGETVIRKLTEKELQEIYQYGIDLYYNLESYLEHEEQ